MFDKWFKGSIMCICILGVVYGILTEKIIYIIQCWFVLWFLETVNKK